MIVEQAPEALTSADDEAAVDSTPATGPAEPAGENGEQPAPGEDPAPAPGEDDGEDDTPDGDTFDRAYVEKIRDRSARYRTRANAADERTAELEQALFTERVRALDVLADPADLPFSADMLDDPEALAEAARALVAERPHYARRGTTSAEATGSRETARPAGDVSLFGMMRNGT